MVSEKIPFIFCRYFRTSDFLQTIVKLIQTDRCWREFKRVLPNNTPGIHTQVTILVYTKVTILIRAPQSKSDKLTFYTPFQIIANPDDNRS